MENNIIQLLYGAILFIFSLILSSLDVIVLVVSLQMLGGNTWQILISVILHSLAKVISTNYKKGLKE